jgi:tRNA A37 threonylcarbamoyladenosine dehydratase
MEDSNEIHNIASQGTYMDEIGMKKVKATKNRILKINPQAKVIVYEHHLLESHNSNWFNKVLKQVPNRDQILIVGFTDDFYAQAHTVNFALENNIPYLSKLFSYQCIQI